MNTKIKIIKLLKRNIRTSEKKIKMIDSKKIINNKKNIIMININDPNNKKKYSKSVSNKKNGMSKNISTRDMISYDIIENNNNIFLTNVNILDFMKNNIYLIYFDANINIYDENTILLINLTNYYLKNGNKILLLTDQNNIKKSILFDFENINNLKIINNIDIISFLNTYNSYLNKIFIKDINSYEK